METLTIENELVPIIKETGIEQATENLLLERFTPFLEQVREWKQKAESLVVTDVAQVPEMKMARTARLAIRQIRIEADKTRKELKEDSLRYGRAVQAVYNVIEAAITPIETHLEHQEKFKERKEAEERALIKSQREDLASPYREFIPYGIDFGEITETDFQNLLNGGKMQLKAKEDAIAQAAEVERMRKEKEAEERERLRVENEKLKAREEELKRVADARNELIMQRTNELRPYMQFGPAVETHTLWELSPNQFAELLDSKIAAFDKVKVENIEAAKRKAELDKLEAELKAKKDAEERAEADKLAAIEAELSMGDKAKFAALLEDLKSFKTKYIFKSKKYKMLYIAVQELIEKIIVYTNSKN